MKNSELVKKYVALFAKVVQEIDKWISEGRFVNRGEAIKTILVLYQEMDRTREFYRHSSSGVN
jgi:Arc/MetJ-type ribon-helix-helix transcriptional regulator